MKGCEMCPNNEDVWLEAARLQVRGSAIACGWLGRVHALLRMAVSSFLLPSFGKTFLGVAPNHHRHALIPTPVIRRSRSADPRKR